jgi:tetratricopeptide (TPR) repeat protein
MPDTARLLLERGQDLVGAMVAGQALATRLIGAAPTSEWLPRLCDLVESAAHRPPGAHGSQPAILDAYTQVVAGLSLHRPLLLVVDDLQWIDRGSIGLLFHLARMLAGFRIQLALAFRPEATREKDEANPVASLLNEIRALFGDCVLEVEGRRAFVDAMLDVETNRIDAGFRSTLHRFTGGHPLFVAEVLASMKERGEIVRDADGAWAVRENPDWDRLPARVEAVVEERLARATSALAADLRVAAVQGEDFVVEAAARVRGVEAEVFDARLVEAVQPPLRVVEPVGIEGGNGAARSRYRFRHVLFQRHLYGSLDEVRRARLHEATGRALEQLWKDAPSAIAVELVRHFDLGGRPDRALHYAQMAAQRALELSAHDEAIVHLRHALALIPAMPATSDLDRRHLGLLISLGAALQAARGYAAPETGDAYARAEEICGRLGDLPEVAQALAAAATFHALRGRFDQAVDLSKRLLDVAERLGDPLLLALAHLSFGWQLLPLGRIEEAHRHLQEMVAFYDPAQHGWLAHAFGTDPGVTAIAWSSWTLWFLGYPDQAVDHSRRAIDLARHLGHGPTLAFALAVAGTVFHLLRNDHEAALPAIEELEDVAGRKHLAQFQAFARVYQGSVEGRLGDTHLGIAAIRQGLSMLEDIGTDAYRVFFLVAMAEMHSATGEIGEAQATLKEAQDLIGRTGEHLVEPTLWLVSGRVQLAGGDQAAAQEAFEAAVEIAHAQGNKMLELRALVAIDELRLAQGLAPGEHHRLRSIYESFTEGFDAPDLLAAATVLDEA